MVKKSIKSHFKMHIMKYRKNTSVCFYITVGLVHNIYRCLPVKIVRPMIHCCGIFKPYSCSLTKTYIITLSCFTFLLPQLKDDDDFLFLFF